MNPRVGVLLLLAILAGVLWRAEVELHGWAGLAWLTYFHVAIPISVGLFIAWAAWAAPVSGWRRRAGVAAALCVVAPPGYLATSTALSMAFASGPSAMFLLMSLPPAAVVVPMILGLLAAPLLAVQLVARLSGAAVGWGRVAAALSLAAVAWPAAIVLLRLLDHRGGADLLHALKSGLVVPPVVVAFGLAFLAPRRERATRPTAPDRRG